MLSKYAITPYGKVGSSNSIHASMSFIFCLADTDGIVVLERE